MLFYTQKNLDEFNPQLSLGKAPLTDFDAIKEEFEKKLLALVEDMLTTEYFPMVKAGGNSSCESCKYKLLCGRKAQREK